MTQMVADGIDLSLSAEDILHDYRLAYQSRQASIIGRREVLSGKAKFGIFGDGKEVVQLAMARAFQKGDFRSGYYRDQTFAFATGMATIQHLFAQLYAHADLQADPNSAGRAMDAHFATRSLDPQGDWLDLVNRANTSADLSPTGAQMPRLVGLAYASRLYRQLEELKPFTSFSHNGDEVAFGTIGNASTAEGIFWESVNAIGVLQAPAVLVIYDDGYGISVPNEYAMVKQSISELLAGFQRGPGSCSGCMEIYAVKGWDYPVLVETFQKAVAITRREHVPSVIHVIEMTQPLGHSTSGSQERYKPKERLEWEQEFDCLGKMRAWMIGQEIITSEKLVRLEAEDRRMVEETRKLAWEAYLNPLLKERAELIHLLDEITARSSHTDELVQIRGRLLNLPSPLRRDFMAAVRDILLAVRDEAIPARQALVDWKKELDNRNQERYGSHLYSQSEQSVLKVKEVKPVYSAGAPSVYGFDVLNACFDAALGRDPRVIAFGEDLGKLGDVNQGFHGLQEKYGELRVSDTGIRETTILGQAIGLALRGLRPIAEIQYLDYLLYALQTISDDLATLHWRTAGGQKAPVIVRTRGHRLEGIWHSGSLMAGIIDLVRGLHVLVPRDMTRAAGFYNTLLRGDEPAIVVEVLNGYRIKERLPDNIGEFTLPLGLPEVLRPGQDVTLVTYGACCRIVLEAAGLLQQVGIEAQVIDVQTLLPFDLGGKIAASLQKTGRVAFVDEDVPGGTSAYMLREVLEVQGGYSWLDSPPITIPGKPHRPAYGSDGDYWSKPNVESIFEAVYELMHAANPGRYPIFYK